METHLINDHCYHYHRTLNQQQQEVVKNGEDMLYYCTACNKIFTRRRDLNRHLRSARVHVSNDNIEGARFPCRMCGKVFTRKDIQRKHEGNKSCMERYSRFLRDASAWMVPSLTFSLPMSLYDTTQGATVGSIAPEVDYYYYYYNSDIQSITTDDTQDDYFMDTPPFLSTTSSCSPFF